MFIADAVAGLALFQLLSPYEVPVRPRWLVYVHVLAIVTMEIIGLYELATPQLTLQLNLNFISESEKVNEGMV